ncbi:MAG: hypothetical protein KAT43_01650 [Nanoarchaeota archaeon]|nr:hypothetical protein [Nanoarchaeota archaeon]
MKKEWFKKTLFYESIQRLKAYPRLVGAILLMDILFIVSMLVLQNVFNVFIPRNVTEIVQLFGPAVVLFGFAYYLLLLFSYSFFGYIMLHCIKSFVKKEKLSFRYLGKYFLLNLFIFILGIICVIIINLGLQTVRPEFMKTYILAILVPFLFLFMIYTFLNHAVFIETKNVKKVIRTSFKIMFTEIKKYYGFLFGNAVLLGILLIILAVLWLIGMIFHGRTEFIMRNILSGMALILFIYIALIFNRIMFYLAILKKK